MLSAAMPNRSSRGTTAPTRSCPPSQADLARIDELAETQGGVIGRRQLREIGIPRGHVWTQLRTRRWQRPHPRTYVIFTGPMPFVTRVWAALVYAGDDATASHETAAYLAGLRDTPPERVELSVRHGHRIASRPGLKIRQTRRLTEKRHPARLPPQTRVEDTILDLTDVAPAEELVIDVILRACQRRLTTAARLAARARQRKRLRWRRLVGELLADVRNGVLSPLERRYYRDVERPHGLPRGHRNQAEGPAGARRYRDVRYRRWRIVVELDGRAAHPSESREHDDLRDNDLLARERARTLRYGWRSVTTRPCETAAQVADVLSAAGWTGALTECGPGCTAIARTAPT